MSDEYSADSAVQAPKKSGVTYRHARAERLIDPIHTERPGYLSPRKGSSYQAMLRKWRVWLDRTLKLLVSERPPASTGYRFLVQRLVSDLAQQPPADFGHTLLFSNMADPHLGNETLLLLSYYLADEMDASVVVVDATLNQTGVTAWLNLTGVAGFAHLIRMQGDDGAEHERINIPTIAEGVSCLPSGFGHADYAVPRIGTADAQRLKAFLSERFDFVIFQQQGICTDTRYIGLARQANLVMLHMRERETATRAFDAAQSCFNALGIDGIRHVLTEK